jgi:hypothetical protein
MMVREDWGAVLTRDYLAGQLNAGRSPAEIAQTVGCALNTVKSHLRRHRLEVPRGRRPTDDHLAERYAALGTIRALAAELDVPYARARDWLVDANVHLGPAAPPRTEFDIDEAVRRYNDGEGFQAIADALGIPMRTLRDRLVDDGLVVPRRRGRPRSATKD